MEYQSLRENGSTVFFLMPFLPLDNLLFLHGRGKWRLENCQASIVTESDENSNLLADSHGCEASKARIGW